MSKDRASRQGNAILVLVAMVVGVLIGLLFAQSGMLRQGTPTATVLQGKMDEVLNLVQKEYVEEVDVDSISEHLLAVMLSELDPHSSYLTVRESERTEELMRGNFEGVGLLLRRIGDSTFVEQVLPNGPSKGVGILPGDRRDAGRLGSGTYAWPARYEGPSGGGKSGPNDAVRHQTRSGDTKFTTILQHARRYHWLHHAEQLHLNQP